MNPLDDATWMAYVDGGLDAEGRRAVEAAMAADPALAARVQAQQALRQRLQRGLAPELDEPVPAALAALLQPTPAPSLATQPAWAGAGGPAPGGGRRPWPAWAVAAAGVLLGAALMRALPTPAGADLRIDGALAQALEQRLGSEAPGPDGWQLPVSYRNQAGALCRSFVGAGQAGLACKDDAQWRLRLLMPAPAAPAGELRQAATALPPALLEALDADRAGDALDPAAEAAARQRGWR